MKDKICIFAGTTEGRRLAEILCDTAEVTACVATEYGEAVLDSIKGISVHTGRMDADEMAAFLIKGGFDRVIDATHPYADVATENITTAAKKAAVPVMRILREEDRLIDSAVYADSIQEARDFLAEHEGNILITTGAKKLSAYAGLDMSRVWARVLPTASSLEACEGAGVAVSRIIAAQGPFSYEMNLAQLNMIGAKYLVTKASGKNGGFEEKIRAAVDAGAVPIIIGRPSQISGLTIDEALSELLKTDGASARKITVIGIGPGDPDLMTEQAKAAIEKCGAVFGAQSAIETLDTAKPVYPTYKPEIIKEILADKPYIRRAAVVLRGDTGFFSGAKNILKAFANDDVSIIPGVSSVSLFASRLGVSYDGAACVSLHGRRCNIVRTVDRHQKTFVLCGGENSAQAICRRLCGFGLGYLNAAVGELLSYPEERIMRGSVEELAEKRFDPLAALYIENPDAVKMTAVGIPDESFVRDNVPMTKAEVRAVSLSKLSLSADSVVWDIGAGTGSVSVECAFAAYEGQVYAVEKDPEAIDLIQENRKRFRADNIKVVEGEAPDIMSGLPSPTHVFIGGSGGKAEDIIAAALEKNPGVRIVMNTVTLESQTEAFACMKRFGFTETEAVQIGVSRSRKVGSYHMMNALNPVMIFVMQGVPRDV